MSWRNQYRRRDKERAAEIPPEEFSGALDPSEDFPSGHFLVGDDQRGYRIALWHRERGLYAMRSHDNALCFAKIRTGFSSGKCRPVEHSVLCFEQAAHWFLPVVAPTSEVM